MAQAATISTGMQQTDVLSTIGRTPLVRLMHVAADLPGIEICGKAEYFNPGGSVKDRPALNMILDGERSRQAHPRQDHHRRHQRQHRHRLRHDRRARGYHVKLCLPGMPALERKRMLNAYGAEVVFTDPGGGHRRRHPQWPRDLRWPIPDQYFYPDQYNNPANWKAHFETTGPEIIEQTEAGSRISWPAWAPAEPSWASRGGCGATCRT